MSSMHSEIPRNANAFWNPRVTRRFAIVVDFVKWPKTIEIIKTCAKSIITHDNINVRSVTNTGDCVDGMFLPNKIKFPEGKGNGLLN